MKQNVFLYRTLCGICKPLLKIFFPYKVNGKENISGNNVGYILCSNHLSNFDAVFLAIELNEPICFMAKSQLFKKKLLGWILSAIGTFPVERGKDNGKAIEMAKNVIEENKVLGIFLEGTRSKTGEFLRPRSGVSVLAYSTGASILPVCITGKDNGKIKMFKRTTITFGKMININELDMNNGSLSEFRNASKLIMSRIKLLREDDIELKGIKV